MNPILNLEEQFCEYLKAKDQSIWLWILNQYKLIQAWKIWENGKVNRKHIHMRKEITGCTLNKTRISIENLLVSKILLILKLSYKIKILLTGSNPQYISKCFLNTKNAPWDDNHFYAKNMKNNCLITFVICFLTN